MNAHAKIMGGHRETYFELGALHRFNWSTGNGPHLPGQSSTVRILPYSPPEHFLYNKIDQRCCRYCAVIFFRNLRSQVRKKNHREKNGSRIVAMKIHSVETISRR